VKILFSLRQEDLTFRSLNEIPTKSPVDFSIFVSVQKWIYRYYNTGSSNNSKNSHKFKISAGGPYGLTQRKRTSFGLFVIGSFYVGVLFVLIELLDSPPRDML